MSLTGFTSPRTPTGAASLVPPPPWDYAGDFLVIDYWAQPELAATVLPAGIEPDPEGRCAAIFVEWQSASAGGEELLDPGRSQYKECFLVVNGTLDGEPVTTCPFIWVDQDFALARGWIQGFPKKLGEVWMTRTFGLDVAADPGTREGSRHGATCSARGHRLAEATLTLTGVSETGAQHNDAPLVNVRYFPRLAAGRHEEPHVHELVRAVSRDRAASVTWEGDATLSLHGAPGEEHDLLAPVRVGRGYRFQFAYTVDDLVTVRELA